MNYTQIQTAITNNQSFTHSSNMTAMNEWRGSHEFYVIYSYTTEVFTQDLENGETWINPQKYSQTTSRQVNLIKKAKNLN